MKLIVSLNSKEYISDFRSMGVNTFIVGTKYFSCRNTLQLDYCDIIELSTNSNIYVLVNALIEEHDLESLKEHLIALSKTAVVGLVFHDFAVLQLSKELGLSFDLIYNPETLNTNYQTLNVLKEQGVSGAFLSREISLEDKNMIASKTSLKTMLQIHGVEYLAYSKRKLITNYASFINKDINPTIDNNIEIIANNTNFPCHIYEDKFGSHILSKQQLCCLDIMSLLGDFDYLYIESMYITPRQLLEIVYLYVQALESLENNTYGKVKQEIMPLLNKLTPNIEYYHSFMFDNTVYKISDVREKERYEKD